MRLLFALLLLCASAFASNAVYVGQSAAGANDGTSCANQKAASYFNTAGNWSATPSPTQIGPDTTVHLCGTITTQLVFKGNGTSGHPITLLCDSTGCDLTQIAAAVLDLQFAAYVVIDGNSVGIMELTGNGTGIATSVASVQLSNNAGSATGTEEIKGWTMRNVYVHKQPVNISSLTCTAGSCTATCAATCGYQSGSHTEVCGNAVVTSTPCNESNHLVITTTNDSTASTTLTFTDASVTGGPTAGGIISDDFPNNTQTNVVNLSNTLGANFSFHDNVVSDVCWAVQLGAAVSGSPLIDIYNNTFSNYDHAIAVDTASGTYSIHIHDNQLGTTVNWDTGLLNSYHHDGIHTFGANNTNSLNTSIYNNKYSGDWGSNNTAFIFEEIGPTNNYIYNEVGIAQGHISNGLFNVGGVGTNGLTFVNNTAICAGNNSADVGITVDPGSNNVTVQNNAVTGCGQFVSNTSVTGSVAVNHNQYGNVVAGATSQFSMNGTGYASFAAWQAAGFDASPSTLQSSLNLSAAGVPAVNSAVRNNGANLTSLGITALNSDATAGNTRSALSRPAAIAWDVGAFNYVGGHIINSKPGGGRVISFVPPIHQYAGY